MRLDVRGWDRVRAGPAHQDLKFFEILEQVHSYLACRRVPPGRGSVVAGRRAPTRDLLGGTGRGALGPADWSTNGPKLAVRVQKGTRLNSEISSYLLSIHQSIHLLLATIWPPDSIPSLSY